MAQLKNDVNVFVILHVVLHVLTLERAFQNEIKWAIIIVCSYGFHIADGSNKNAI